MTQRHITRYATEAAYDSDFDNLDFPNVSYIDEGDEVRYSEEHPYLITGKSTYTEPFTVYINGTKRTVTLDPTTGDWKINLKQYTPLTSLYFFLDRKPSVSAVNFPKSFDTSKVKSTYQMFNDCKSLTSLDVSNFDTSKVTEMQSMFDSCESLTSLDVSNFDTSKVKSTYRIFADCSNLTSLDLSNWDTSNVTYMVSMFEGCSNLITLSIPQIGNGVSGGVYSFLYMFNRCTKLTTIPSCGEIHNGVDFSSCPLTLDSAKVVLNALSTPYQGAQTLTFSTKTKGYINADSEALAIVAEKQALGWTIAL